MSSLPGDCSNGLEFCDRSLTKQSFAKDADINNILASYSKTGILANANTQIPLFGDFTNVPDYQTSLNMVNDANQRFSQLDARVRDRFGNDPAKLLAFLSDDSNYVCYF